MGAPRVPRLPAVRGIGDVVEAKSDLLKPREGMGFVREVGTDFLTPRVDVKDVRVRTEPKKDDVDKDGGPADGGGGRGIDSKPRILLDHPFFGPGTLGAMKSRMITGQNDARWHDIFQRLPDNGFFRGLELLFERLSAAN